MTFLLITNRVVEFRVLEIGNKDIGNRTLEKLDLKLCYRARDITQSDKANCYLYIFIALETFICGRPFYCDRFVFYISFKLPVPDLTGKVLHHFLIFFKNACLSLDGSINFCSIWWVFKMRILCMKFFRIWLFYILYKQWDTRKGLTWCSSISKVMLYLFKLRY